MKKENQLLESTNLKKNDLELPIEMKYLMEELRVHKLVTRNSLNEFIARHVILSHKDIHEFIEKYDETGIIISFESDNKKFELKLEDLINFIGFCPFKYIIFNYNWTQKQFIDEFFPHHFTKFKNSLKDRLITDDYLNKLNIKVKEITDAIDENIFTASNTDCPLDKVAIFDCKDSDKLFSVYGPSILSEEDYLFILNHLFKKSEYNHFKNDTDQAYTDKMFDKIDLANEIISIGYGVKNGHISPKAIIGRINYDSTPFYEVRHFKLLEDYINESTFESILQKWNFDKWKDILPVTNETL